MKTKLCTLLLLAGLAAHAQTTNTVTITNVVDVPVYITNTIEYATNVIDVPVYTTNQLYLTNTLPAAVILTTDSPAYVAADSLVNARFLLTPGDAGNLMSLGYMRNGSITLENGLVIISGFCRIDIPVAQADQLIKPPNGLSYSQLQPGGTFARTPEGFAGSVTFKQ